MRSRTLPSLPWRGFSKACAVTKLCGCIAVLASLTSFSSCAILFPDRTAPKSQSYTVSPPSKPWHKLAVSEDPNATDAMKADQAYENPETGAIISVNSICRKYNHSSLEVLTSNLVRGVGERKQVRQDEVTLDGAKALDTLFEGVVDGVFLNLRTVVLIKGDCTYDFIHVVVPKREPGNSRAFDEFLASFHTSGA